MIIEAQKYHIFTANSSIDKKSHSKHQHLNGSIISYFWSLFHGH